MRRLVPGTALAVASGAAMLAAAGALAQTVTPEVEPPVGVDAVNPIQNMPGSPATPRGIGDEAPRVPTGAPAGPENALPFAPPTPLTEESLYAGFRVEDLIGEPVLGRDGGIVGTTRDLVFGPDGRVRALVAESGGFLDIGNSYFRVPWEDVSVTPGEPGVAVPVTEENAEIYDPFDERDFVVTGPRAFRATEVIGDYVQLRDQTGFGIVVDLVVAPEGRLRAALVTRRGAFGGGLYAYPYTGTGEGGAMPGENGRVALPYDTPEDAARAIPADPERFGDPF
ncbi:PRC-barrel domain-containing protein [Salinarimonas rosea]|uniref:PRC-barrel domain-containing protein n=1 Tax=Salinarimonas rosea TaxID=552063 RepID=UPI0003FDED10|nr:PRC-barrel domain-containing protein [Salinarimonas rosea]